MQYYYINNYEPNIETEIITNNSVIFPITSKREFSGLSGRRFPLFTMGKVSEITMIGAKYSLKNVDFKVTDYIQSISNVIKKDNFSIKIYKGFPLFILYDKGYS